MAVIICTAIIGLTAMLMPSTDAPASDAPTKFTQPQVSDPESLSPFNQPRDHADVSKAASANTQIAMASQSLQPATSQPTEQTPEIWQDITVRSGDTLTSIFKRAGLTGRDAFLVSSAVKGTDALKRIYPGQTLSFVLEDKQLVKLKHIRNQLESSLLTATGQGYSVKEITKHPEIAADRKSTRLNSSHITISYAVFCLKKKKIITTTCFALPIYRTVTRSEQIHTCCNQSLTFYYR